MIESSRIWRRKNFRDRFLNDEKDLQWYVKMNAKTRTQILEDTELKHFPLFCPKCKKNYIIDVRNRIVEYQTDARR